MKTNDNYDFCLFKIPSDGGRLIWEITNKCNYSCKYCIFSSGQTDTKDELSFDQISSVLEDIWKFGIKHLKLTGGEPFTRSDMDKILNKASEIGFDIDISTNASLLTDKHINALKNPAIKYVHVSLDGSDKIMQALVRGDYTYDLTLRGIKKLVNAGIYTRIGTVIHKGNENHLKEMIENVINLGVQEVIFSLMEPVGRMKGDNGLVATKDYNFFEKKLDLLKLKYADKIKVEHAFTKKIEKKCSSESCPGGSKFLFINHKGQLSPCTWISEYFPEFVSRDTLKTRSFTELTESNEMRNYQDFKKYLTENSMAGCPKSYLKEINEIKSNSKLFKGNLEENIGKSKKFSTYSQIYSFATENLSGYLKSFDFKDANVLTVTGSGDQAINASLLGAKNITCFDSNILSSYWTEFKILAIEYLDYHDFLDFFMNNGRYTLSFDIYYKFRNKLKITTRAFFDKMYESFGFDGKKLRYSRIFNQNNDIDEKKIAYNPYLQSELSYNIAKNALKNVHIEFLNISIEDMCKNTETLFNKDFDLILLSNIADYSHLMYPTSDYLLEFKKKIIDSLYKLLSQKGKLIIAYIYFSANAVERNQIDSPTSRLKLFGGFRYNEVHFPSAIDESDNDTVAYLEYRVTNSLIENSTSYYENADVYDMFSEAEDSERKVLAFLKNETKDKVVLDVGCGTGKYLKLLASSIKKGIGVDISDKQIAIAKQKCKTEHNLEFIVSTAEKIDLPDNCVDVIYGTWCIGSIPDAERRENIVKELKRILKKSGKMYLIENEETGEFEEIRGKTANPTKPTNALNRHIGKMGFNRFKSISTSFDFKDTRTARKVFGTIWGEQIAGKISSNEIKHNIVIFAR